VPIVLKSGNLNLLEPSETVQPCTGIALPYSIVCNVVLIEGYTNFSRRLHFARWHLISVGPMYRILLMSAFWPVPTSGGRRRYKLSGFCGLERKPEPRLCCICFCLSRIFASECYNAEHLYPEDGNNSAVLNVGAYPPNTIFYVSRNVKLNLI